MVYPYSLGMSRNGWGDFEDFITGEMQQPDKLMRLHLAALAAEGVLPLLRHLFSEEKEYRARVDDYARRRAAGEEIDQADAFVLWWYRQRVMCAADTLGILWDTPVGKKRLLPSPPRLWTMAEVRQWALLSLWQRRYDHWLKLCAINYAHGLPLYGLEPADGDSDER